MLSLGLPGRQPNRGRTSGELGHQVVEVVPASEFSLSSCCVAVCANRHPQKPSQKRPQSAPKAPPKRPQTNPKAPPKRPPNHPKPTVPSWTCWPRSRGQTSSVAKERTQPVTLTNAARDVTQNPASSSGTRSRAGRGDRATCPSREFRPAVDHVARDLEVAF